MTDHHKVSSYEGIVHDIVVVEAISEIIGINKTDSSFLSKECYTYMEHRT